MLRNSFQIIKSTSGVKWRVEAAVKCKDKNSRRQPSRSRKVDKTMQAATPVKDMTSWRTWTTVFPNSLTPSTTTGRRRRLTKWRPSLSANRWSYMGWLLTWKWSRRLSVSSMPIDLATYSQSMLHPLEQVKSHRETRASLRGEATMVPFHRGHGQTWTGKTLRPSNEWVSRALLDLPRPWVPKREVMAL